MDFLCRQMSTRKKNVKINTTVLVVLKTTNGLLRFVDVRTPRLCETLSEYYVAGNHIGDITIKDAVKCLAVRLLSIKN